MAQAPFEIPFPNGNTAKALVFHPGQDAASVLPALDLKPPPALLLVAGGAATLDDAAAAYLAQLFSRGLARAALQAGAMLVDGGTQAGVMRLMGEAVADRGRKTVLLGVAPKGKVTYPAGPGAGIVSDGAPLDPNHSHFVLVDSDAWGGETDTLFALAEALVSHPSRAPSEYPVPVIMLLAGGGNGAREEVLQGVRRGWPILVVQGSGGTADDIASAWQQQKRQPTFIADPLLAEIVADGDIRLFPLTDTPRALEQRILHLVHQLGGDTLLRRAWQRFAVYDLNAVRHQRSFGRLQGSILGLGILAVLLVILQAEIFGTDPSEEVTSALDFKVLRWIIIAVPILISVLLAAADRFKAGNKWILLRSAAEAVKREIYRFRTRAGLYSDAALSLKERAGEENVTREAMLARRLKEISGQLLTTTVNEAAFLPYEGPLPPPMHGAAGKDDGASDLTPSQYIDIRIQDQLAFFKGKTNKLGRRLKVLRWGIYLAGGIGTLLAAVGLELWVALTTALAGAATTYLEYRQVQYTLTKYNQTVTDLENVRDWWTGLTPAEQAHPHNQSLLVEQAEKVLENELAGWVQQMQDALAELQEKQAKEVQGKVRTPREAALPPEPEVEPGPEASVAPGRAVEPSPEVAPGITPGPEQEVEEA